MSVLSLEPARSQNIEICLSIVEVYFYCSSKQGLNYPLDGRDGLCVAFFFRNSIRERGGCDQEFLQIISYLHQSLKKSEVPQGLQQV